MAAAGFEPATKEKVKENVLLVFRRGNRNGGRT
jgi:hypothetical protein